MLYTRTEQNSEFNNLNSYFKKLKKERQSKSRRKDIVRIEAEINKIENRNTIEQINKSKSRFFARTDKIDKLLARLTKTKRKKNQNINNKTEDITTDYRAIKGTKML